MSIHSTASNLRLKLQIELQLTAKTINYCSKQYVKPKYNNLRLKHYWVL